MAVLKNWQWLHPIYWVVLTALGGLGVYTDLKRGIVTNRNILALLVLGLAVQVHAIIMGRQTWVGAAELVSIGMIFGLTLFLLQFWAAGDGKFFWALCLSMPVGMQVPWAVQLPTQMFTATVMLAGAYLVLTRSRRLAHGLKAELTMIWQRWHRPRLRMIRGSALRAVESLIQYLAFVGVVRLFQLVIPYNLGIVQSLLVAYGIRFILDQVGRKGQWLMMGLLAPLSLVITYLNPLAAWGQLGAAYLIAMATRTIIAFMNRYLQSRRPLESLAPGLFLADYIARNPNGTYLVVRAQEWQQRRREMLLVLGPDDGALGPAEVKTIKDLTREGLLPASTPVGVTWTIPFAPFIAGGSFLVLLLNFITNL